MLPCAIFISLHPKDALFEIGAVFVIGSVLAVSYASLGSEREYRTQLEMAHRELRASEERYRQLFENVHDSHRSGVLTTMQKRNKLKCRHVKWT